MTNELVTAVRVALSAGGDPERALQQQAYMKSAMPYRGFTKPGLTTALRPLLAAYRPESRSAWEADVRALWDGATHREEWYAALLVARHRRARAWLDGDVVPLVRHLVVTGAWWDVVDETAQHLVRPALDAHPAALTPVLWSWATEANVDDPSFWLRKGIGWALRDLARTDPDWVRAEVARHGDRLSGLSRREALKHLARGG